MNDNHIVSHLDYKNIRAFIDFVIPYLSGHQVQQLSFDGKTDLPYARKRNCCYNRAAFSNKVFRAHGRTCLLPP